MQTRQIIDIPPFRRSPVWTRAGAMLVLLKMLEEEFDNEEIRRNFARLESGATDTLGGIDMGQAGFFFARAHGIIDMRADRFEYNRAGDLVRDLGWDHAPAAWREDARSAGVHGWESLRP